MDNLASSNYHLSNMPTEDYSSCFSTSNNNLVSNENSNPSLNRERNASQTMHNSFENSSISNSYVSNRMISNQYSVNSRSSISQNNHMMNSTPCVTSNCIGSSTSLSNIYGSIISPKEMAEHEASNFKDVKGVYKNCRGIWAAQWTDERGQRHTKYFNPKYYATEAEARREAFKFKVHIAKEIELKGGVQKRRLSNSGMTPIRNNYRESDSVIQNSYTRERAHRPYKTKKGKLSHLKSVIDREMEKSCFDVNYNYLHPYPYPYSPISYSNQDSSKSTLLYQDMLMDKKQNNQSSSIEPKVQHYNPSALSHYIPSTLNSSSEPCYSIIPNFQTNDYQSSNFNIYDSNYFPSPFDPTYLAALNRFSESNNGVNEEKLQGQMSNFNKSPITHHYLALPHGTTLCACGCGGLALSPSRYSVSHTKPLKSDNLPAENKLSPESYPKDTFKSQYNHDVNLSYNTNDFIPKSNSITSLHDKMNESWNNSIKLKDFDDDAKSYDSKKINGSIFLEGVLPNQGSNDEAVGSSSQNSLTYSFEKNAFNSYDFENPFSVLASSGETYVNSEKDDKSSDSIEKESQKTDLNEFDNSFDDDAYSRTHHISDKVLKINNSDSYLKMKSPIESEVNYSVSDTDAFVSSAYSVDSSPSFPFDMSWEKCFSFYTSYPLNVSITNNECDVNI